MNFQFIVTFVFVRVKVGPPVITVTVISAVTAEPKNVKIISPTRNHRIANAFAKTPFGKRSP